MSKVNRLFYAVFTDRINYVQNVYNVLGKANQNKIIFKIAVSYIQ